MNHCDLIGLRCIVLCGFDFVSDYKPVYIMFNSTLLKWYVYYNYLVGVFYFALFNIYKKDFLVEFRIPSAYVVGCESNTTLWRVSFVRSNGLSSKQKLKKKTCYKI